MTFYHFTHPFQPLTHSLLAPTAPPHPHQAQTAASPPMASPRRSFRLDMTASKRQSGHTILIHPNDLIKLGVLEGDTVSLYDGRQTRPGTIMPSYTITPGHVALSAPLQEQIHIGWRRRLQIGGYDENR